MPVTLSFAALVMVVLGFFLFDKYLFPMQTARCTEAGVLLVSPVHASVAHKHLPGTGAGWLEEGAKSQLGLESHGDRASGASLWHQEDVETMCRDRRRSSLSALSSPATLDWSDALS